MNKKIIGWPIAILFVLFALGTWSFLYLKFFYTKPLTAAQEIAMGVDWDFLADGKWSPWLDANDGGEIWDIWDPATSFNSWLDSVPQEDKAWPILVEAHYRFAVVDTEAIETFDEQVDAGRILSHEYRGTLPNDPQRWAILKEAFSDEAHADSYSELTAMLKDALSRPVMGVPMLDSTDPIEHAAMLAAGLEDENWDPEWKIQSASNMQMINTLIPSLARMRIMSSYMYSQAALALENGDGDEFVELVTLMMDSSKLTIEIPVLISQLVQQAINQLGISTIDWALRAHAESFNQEQLQALDELLDRHTGTRLIWEGEALFFHDTFRRFADSTGKIDSASMKVWLDAGGFDGTQSSASSVSLYQAKPSFQRPIWVYNSAMKLVGDASRVPWDERVESAERFVQQELPSMAITTRMMLEIMMPAMDKASTRFREQTQQMIGTRTAISVLRYIAMTGELPESLDAIKAFDKENDQSLLSFDPIDAISAQQLLYRVTDQDAGEGTGAGFVIYSVGDNRADDQGEPMWMGEGADRELLQEPTWRPRSAVEFASNSTGAQLGGDWVLFPMFRSAIEPIDYVDDEDDYDEDWDLED